LVHRPLAAAWYCSNTLAGIRPRSLTVMPCSLAHARTSPLRCRPADVRAVRRAGPRLALRACSMNGVLLAKGTGVLGAQVDLVLGAVEPESQRLIRGAAIQVVFPRYSDLLSRLSLQCRRAGFAAPSPAMIPHTSRNGADHTPVPGSNRRGPQAVTRACAHILVSCQLWPSSSSPWPWGGAARREGTLLTASDVRTVSDRSTGRSCSLGALRRQDVRSAPIRA